MDNTHTYNKKYCCCVYIIVLELGIAKMDIYYEDILIIDNLVKFVFN